MSDLHMSTLVGAWVAGRERLVAELRALGAGWPEGVYAESRGTVDSFDALGYLDHTANLFSVFVVGEQPEVAFDEKSADLRTYRPSYLLLFIGKAKDGAREDEFLSRLEAAVLRLAGMYSLTLPLLGADVEFRIAGIENAIPFENLTTASGSAAGHSATERITLEVQACAS